MYKEEEEIKMDMLSRVENTFDKSPNSFIHDALAGTALELSSFYIELEYIKGKLDVLNWEGAELDKYVYQKTGMIRRPATHATSTVTILGTEGTVVEKGVLVSGGSVDYEVTESVEIGVSGEVEAKIKAVEPGSVGNAPSNVIDTFPVTINGLISVTNTNPITNGYDQEDDDAYRERYLERRRTPATSGNKHHYKVWAKEVTGVGDARIDSLWNGNNTVKVTIIDSNKGPADEELVAMVQEHIDPGGRGLGEGQAPIGAFANVVSAKAREINVTAKIVIDNQKTLQEVSVLVRKNITDYLKEIAFEEEIISYARIGAVILSTDNVVDYSDLTVNNDIRNILIANDEVAVLGGVELIE